MGLTRLAGSSLRGPGSETSRQTSGHPTIWPIEEQRGSVQYLSFRQGKRMCPNSRQKLCLDRTRHLMIILPPIPQQRINLINEDDGRFHLPRKRKQPSDQLVALPVPLVGQGRQRDVDERCSGLFGERFGEHGFPAAGGTVQEDAFGCGEETGGGVVQLGVDEGVDDRL